MEQYNNIPGYELIRTENLSDVKGTGLLFKHMKSGARIGVVKNDDDNKVFCIGFKTPPKNSTGVAHITEHSVLCGSAKFPAKDPFVELCKGSLNTFLNAFTAPDKTMYPVASCNEKDFKNLMDVYMDAILHPNTYTRPQILKQEGWHYELEDENAELKINGVVYSEMKGVYSSPDQLFYRIGSDLLYPDTEYGVDSGGDPDVIPELSYEEFLNFHKKFYHPSNSYIWLYGDVDVEERLTWMDKEYLSKYDTIQVESSIKYQEPFGTIREYERFYSVEEEKKDGKGYYYSYNVFAGENSDLLKGLGFEILDYCLFAAPGAPVRQALVDAGIGDEVVDYYDGETMQPNFVIGVKNAKAGQKDLFVKIVRDTLSKVVKEGISESTLRAAINSQEFRYKEADFGRYPKGLMYGMTCFGTWVHNDDLVFNSLHMNEVYDEIKTKIGTGWFENLITEYFLESKHGVVLTFAPKVGLNREKEDKLKKKLADYKASLSKEQIKALVEDTKALKKYQSEPSTEEEMNTIPMLAISDIKREARPFKYEIVHPELGKIVWSDCFTNGIAYIKLFFNMKVLDAGEIGYAGLLTSILSMVNTEKHNYQELNDEINIYTGGFACDTSFYPSAVKENDYKANVWVGIKTLVSEADRAFGYIDEIIGTSVYTDVKRNKEILFEIKSEMEGHFMASGTQVMKDRASAYDSELGMLSDETVGIGYYDFIKNLCDNYDKLASEISSKLKEVSEKLFTKENLTASVICDKNGLDKCVPGLTKTVNALMSKEQPEILHLTPVVKNEGFKTSGQVQYVMQAGNFKKAGIKYTGVFDILTSMLSFGYLWNEIRVKGGAYGASFNTNPLTGFVFAGSFRDPNLKKTYEAIEGLVEHIRNYEADEREMTKAIIGSFGNSDAPLSAKQEGERAFSFYMTGRTLEDVQRSRDEALNCTVQDIRNTAPLFEALVNGGLRCTLGSSAAVEECRDMFKEVKTLC